VVCVGLAWQSGALDQVSRSWQTPGGRLLGAVESPLGLVTASRQAEQASFFINNLWQFSFPDPLSAETKVHYALLQHPAPQRVLLLGGGVAGLASEALKTPTLTRLDYVELDPWLIDLARQTLPPAATSPLDDSRVRVVKQDGRRFLRTCGETYDVILLALPEPQSALLNRFYSREFFQLARRRLTPGGVFSFTLTGSETSLSPLRARYLALGYQTLKQVFPEVKMFPGLQTHFFATQESGLLVTAPETLLERLRTRGLALHYLQEDALYDLLVPGKLAVFNSIVHGTSAVANRDLAPQCYYYDLLLTAGQENSLLQRILLRLGDVPPGVIWVCLAVAATVLSLRWRRATPAGDGPALLSIGIMGLTAMALEVIMLIFFQTLLGVVYSQTALLLAAFMLGLAAGAGLVRRWRPGAGQSHRLALASQGGLALLTGTLALGLPALAAWPELGRPGWGQVLTAGVLLLGGLLSGCLFAAQAEARRGAGEETARVAGRLYAVDLLGGTCGALGTTLVAVPVWGLPASLGLLAGLNLTAVAVLARASQGLSAQGPR
jgi:spermidine synthase